MTAHAPMVTRWLIRHGTGPGSRGGHPFWNPGLKHGIGDWDYGAPPTEHDFIAPNTETEIALRGEEVPAQFLGRGMFAKAYRSGDHVYIFVKDDRSKDLLDGLDNPHLPKIEKVDTGLGEEGRTSVYQMPFYEDFGYHIDPRNQRLWRQFRELSVAIDEASDRAADFFPDKEPRDWATYSAAKNTALLEILDRAPIPDSLYDAIKLLVDTIAAKAPTYMLEFPEQNLGIDQDGNLILRDVLFDPRISDHGYIPNKKSLAFFKGLLTTSVEHPGIRGGKGYYNRRGHWEYGEPPSSHSRYKKGTETEIVVKGEPVPAIFLGKGAFARAYRVGEQVYVFVKDDYSKEIMSQIDNPHVPSVELVDDGLGQDGTVNLYRMPHYEPLTTRHWTAWKQYKEIARAHDAAMQEVWERGAAGRSRRYDNYEVNQLTAETAQVPLDLKEGLEQLASWGGNYSGTFAMEFAPRNLGVDQEGRLILLDVLFDPETLRPRGRR